MRILIALILIFTISTEKFEKEIYSEGEYIFSVKIFKNDKEIGLLFTDPQYQLNNNEEQYENAWELGNEKNIEFIGLEILDGMTNGGQKAIKWNYYDKDFRRSSQEVTGLIANDDRIWFHPPRTKFFKILEINPFPEIRLNQTNWSTQLKVGDHWGNERWKTWNGVINIVSEYKLNKDKSTVTAEAKSPIGTTKLNSEFNLEQGFTKLDYQNIDGSRILMELVEIRK
jgi:hypothetical protein